MSREAGAAEPVEPAADDPAPARRSWVRPALSALLVVAMVAGFAWALSGRWSQIVLHVREQSPLFLAAAVVSTVLGSWMSFELWRGTLAVLGSRVGRREGARLFFVTQLGKYLPGSVWPVVAQMRWGRALDIPRQRMALAFLLTLGLSVLLGLVVGVPVVPALLREEQGSLRWVLLALPLLLLLLVPQVVNGLLARALRLLRRRPLERELSARDLGRGVLWTTALWVGFGAHVWVLAVGLGADPVAALAPAIGGFALAFSLGPLLVVFPAGAGVREAVLVIALSGVLSTPQAVAVALTSRGLLLATDGGLALLTAALRPRVRRARVADPA